MSTVLTFPQLQDPPASADEWAVLLLDRLDELLANAVRQSRAAPAAPAAGPDLPGLFITAGDVEQLLHRPPVSSPYPLDASLHTSPLLVDPAWSAWSRLQTTFELDDLDLDLFALALAVDLDLKYQRIFAWLQDDLTRIRPTVDLALNLLCQDRADRSRCLARLDPDAPLIRHGLLRLVPDPHQTAPPGLAHYLMPDADMAGLLRGRSSLGGRLAVIGRLVRPTIDLAHVPVSAGTRRGIERIIHARLTLGIPFQLRLHGPEGSGQLEIAESIAAALGQSLLIVDLATVMRDPDNVDTDLQMAVRHARMGDHVLVVDGLARLALEVRSWALNTTVDRLSGFPGLAILCGSSDQQGLSFAAPDDDEPLPIEIDLPPLDRPLRAAWWRAALTKAGIPLDAAHLDLLASGYRLRPGQITKAVRLASGIAAWQGSPAADLSTLMIAARRQSSADLGTMARRRVPGRGWDDIVLPDDQREQLREICDHASYRHVVHHDWGRAGHEATADGLNVLFSGPSGTGKTMAAEVIAGALGLDLATINIAHTVSKYIGETEKNLDRIFDAALESNVVLFFDEADAIFGKRSQVKDAHDRYANLEVGYLLQKIETHDGVIILGTNLRSNMDDAFTRRLHHVVEFPFPDETLRYQIWRKHLHDRIPQAADLDVTFLARQFEVAGGSIRSIVLNACVFAAAGRQPVGLRHVVLATRREFQKMGRVCDEQTFGDALGLLDRREQGEVAS